MSVQAKCSTHEAGFTLPELLVGLAVMALVSVVLFAGIGRIGIANALVSRNDALVEDIHSAQFVLRQRIERIIPLVDQQTNYSVDMSGTQTSLDFISHAPDQASPNAPYNYRLVLGEHGDLTLYQLNSLDAHTGARQRELTGWTPVPLLKGASALTLSYYGINQTTGTASWQTSWTHRPTLPLLVAIRVSFRDGDPRAWPDLVIHPRAASSDTCRRDITTDQCEGIT